MIKIGYLGHPEDQGGVLGLELLEECKPTPIELLGGDLTRCPAVKGYHMNTFEVKCPFELEWTVIRSREYEGDDRFSWTINEDKTTLNLNNNFFEESAVLGFDATAESVQVLIAPNWSFVSDTKNTIMLQHSNGIDTNPQTITGQMDIYKWPDRALSVGYTIKKDEQTFTLKKGQPWYRLTFFTPELEVVKLVRMEERPKYLKKIKNKHMLSNIKYQNWRKIFNKFGQTRPKKLIP